MEAKTKSYKIGDAHFVMRDMTRNERKQLESIIQDKFKMRGNNISGELSDEELKSFFDIILEPINKEDVINIGELKESTEAEIVADFFLKVINKIPSFVEKLGSFLTDTKFAQNESEA